MREYTLNLVEEEFGPFAIERALALIDGDPTLASAALCHEALFILWDSLISERLELCGLGVGSAAPSLAERRRDALISLYPSFHMLKRA